MERLDEYFTKGKIKETGYKISLINNSEEPDIVKDKAGYPVTAYKFVFLPEKKEKKAKTSKASQISKTYLERYVGRTEEIELFQNLLNNLDNPKRKYSILSLYGFGGIGKSSLLEIFRDIAAKQDFRIEPRLPRDEIVSKSVANWLSDTFHFEQSKERRDKWRDFFSVLEPGTVILMDTVASVNMKEFNNTLQALSDALRKERPDCLIVTATREKPKHREGSRELTGLTSEDIKSLAELRSWKKETADYADKLQKFTDGNPLMIECICEDAELWNRFKSGKLIPARHVEPLKIVLEEMWESLSEEAKESLNTVSLLSSNLKKMKKEWGWTECKDLTGSSWEDVFSELKSKCFLKEKEPDKYEMHELISEFVILRIENLNKRLEEIGDYFSSKGKHEIALRFQAGTDK